MAITLITTIIRIHSLECCTYLRRAMLSIVGQSIEADILLVCQNFSPDELSSVEALVSPYRFGSVSAIKIQNVTGETGADLRSRLLNEGANTAETRYIHFLDYDDILYPNAFEVLIGALKRTSASIAFGGITSTFYETVGPTPYVTHKRREFVGDSRYELYVRNFCPLHSFVIDTARCDKTDIRFDESMSALEDYNFLLNFVAKYNSDFSQINTIIGEYFRREIDTIRSAGLDYPDTSIRLSRLEAAREMINQRKREISTSVRLSEFAWIMQPVLEQPQAVPETAREVQSFEEAASRNRLVARCLYASCIKELDDTRGRIEIFKFTDNKFEVSGWLDDSGRDSGTTPLLLITFDGSVVAEAVRFDRQDVREHFSSDFQEFGFYFEFPGNKNEYSSDDFKVIFAQPNTGDISFIQKYLA
ncbi:glycosyltransferase [Methylobacterium sp. yr668]|uniref:glycosyltransferase n=1 Tax=Methylobacterium sp. yr668 TaxID=1761801 RepID=UPI0008E0E95D|nr:Glycosyl transferase family 2 [Methylobacterium sp. yr668]